MFICKFHLKKSLSFSLERFSWKLDNGIRKHWAYTSVSSNAHRSEVNKNILMAKFIHDIFCSRLDLNYVKYYIIWFNMMWFGKVFDFKSSQKNQFFRISALLNLSCFQSLYLSEAEKNTGLQEVKLLIHFFL